MALSTSQLTRTYVSGALGEGSRQATAVILSQRTVGSPDAVVTTVSISAPASMTAEELTDYQTFVGGLDEEAIIAAGLIVLDEIPA